MTGRADLEGRLAAQLYRCAACGLELRPGDELALAYDGAGLVHLRCARVGLVPARGECVCGCGTRLTGRQRLYASDGCRKRAERDRAPAGDLYGPRGR